MSSGPQFGPVVHSEPFRLMVISRQIVGKIGKGSALWKIAVRVYRLDERGRECVEFLREMSGSLVYAVNTRISSCSTDG